MLEQILVLDLQLLLPLGISWPDWSLSGIPDWIPDWLRIAAVVLSGGLATYFMRLLVDRRKLRRALKTEIRGMDGIKSCKESMESREKPSRSSTDDIQPKHMPAEDSIPTQIYDENVGQLGLLKTDELEKIVRFYIQVKKYKSIITDIRSGKDVPEPDQNELWENIGQLENQRQSLFGDGWMEK